MRCRYCEEPIDVIDLCEACEMRPVTIDPVEVRICERGHLMTEGAGKTHGGWLCVVCRRMRQARFRAARRHRARMDRAAR